MGKKLLTEDCNRIVLKSFNLPDDDHFEYYENIIDEQFNNDEKIIEKLKSALTRWIEWYKAEVNKLAVRIDSNGKIWTEKDRYATHIPLFPAWGIKRSEDLTFYENQMRILEEIERQNKLGIKINILERISANLEKQIDNCKYEKVKHNDHLRRPVAFCICLDHLSGKYDISKMTKKRLIKYIENNFKDKTGHPIASAQKVVGTLCGYLRVNTNPEKDKEKTIFSYDNKTKSWSFVLGNYNYMKSTFPDDYKRALEILS
jgi:hypothetical protein